MMFNWSKKKKDNKLESPHVNNQEEEIEEESTSLIIPDFLTIKKDNDSGGMGAVFNTDMMILEEREELFDNFSGKLDIPIFKGKIENGFSLAKAKSIEVCPECKGRLAQYYADFVYSNGEVSRVNTSPFGYFCDSCPTVVIDIERLSNSLLKGVTLHGIAGINHSKEGLILFKKWNNEKPVFILDEEQNMMGVTTKSEMQKSPELYDDFYRSWEDDESEKWKFAPSAVKKKSKNRKRNKSAKKSRRRNRRKK